MFTSLVLLVLFSCAFVRGSLKSEVSFSKEPYKRDYILHLMYVYIHISCAVSSVQFCICPFGVACIHACITKRTIYVEPNRQMQNKNSTNSTVHVTGGFDE